MRFSIFLLVLSFAGPAPTQAESSQERDAKALVALFAEEGAFEPGLQHDLRIDGCSARFDNGWHYYRFLLSSVDFEAWAANDRLTYIPLDAVTQRQVEPWVMDRGPLPRSAHGWYFDDSTPIEEQRRAKARYEKFNLDYYEQLLRGEFGPWYAEHHTYSVEGGVPYDFRPAGAARVKVHPARKVELIGAMRWYAEKYCLPAPDFSCTPFFVDAPGTVC